MIRSKQARSIVLTALLILSAVWSVGALVGDVVAADDASSDDADDNTKANATAVEVNTTLNASTETQDDVDWYKVEADAGETLLVTLEALEGEDDFEAGEEPKDLTLEVYGPNGEQLENETTYLLLWESVAGSVEPVDESGTYYIKVSAAYDEPAEAEEINESTGPKPYELMVQSVLSDEYEPNYDKANATTLAAGETVSATAIAFDHDTYAVDLDAGETVTFTYTETREVNDYRWDEYGRELYVDGPSVDWTEFNRTELNDGERVTFTVNESGTYYVTLAPQHDNVEASFVEDTDAVRYEMTADVDAESSERGSESDSGADTGTDADNDAETGGDGPDVGDGC